MNAIQQPIPPLTLEQLIRFAGAVQDFNPIHYDEKFAINAGLPGVIAQGPLTFLTALDAVFTHAADAQVTGFRVRLKSPVTPGAILAITCNESGKVSLTSDGVEALSGEVILAQAGDQ